jgi:ABC-type lipoprotein export system ATPase subunit
MGPSGAGKSTLLGILGLYDYLWEGDYFLSDFPVHRLPAKERSLLNKRFIGFVFQQFHLLDDLTVAENLDIPLSYRNIPRSERQGMVAGLRSSHHPPARRLGGKTMNLSMANP